MRLSYLAPALVLLVTAAQAVGPNYKKPDTAMPSHWQAPPPWQDASPLDSIPKGPWWKILGDPELSQYEDRAMANNQTLRAAIGRLAEARATARVTAADLYPEVDLGPTVSRERLSANRPANGSPAPPSGFSLIPLGTDFAGQVVGVAELIRQASLRMLNPPSFQILWFKTRGTRTVQPKPVPWCSQSFLTGHCRATAAL